MPKSDSDDGVILVLLERFNKRCLPRSLRIQKKLARDAKRSDFELAFLDQVLSGARTILPLIDRNPEYKALGFMAIRLYCEIIEQALHNEQE